MSNVHGPLVVAPPEEQVNDAKKAAKGTRLRKPIIAPQVALAYTLAQVATLVQVSLRAAGRWAAEEKIPGRFQVGRVVRFQRDLVDAWIAAGCPYEPRPGRRRRVNAAAD